eukprot:TRINITY_DN5165_c0_g1_i1.p1 TRINITY_DN5165_c0_g1~~TRINITY_DN5165_c0_g1_i1.p1  ORF type:complete len:425 (+),score=127.91 TRINITY_DN5165_c0_g1_i1:91-1275(+)
MFHYCKEENLEDLAKIMRPVSFTKGDMITTQAKKADNFYVMKSGAIRRTKDMNGQLHTVDFHNHSSTVNSLHNIKNEPAYANVECMSDVQAFALSTTDFNHALESHPDLSKDIIYSLSRVTEVMRTPLLEQHPKKIHSPIVVNTIAASIECFYRSALNALLNDRLTRMNPPKNPDGSLAQIPKLQLWPKMHIQMPTRILYINGFKGIRSMLDEKFRDCDLSTMARLGLAVTPGLAMTPVSSVLEACNATSNPEPLHTKWMRGLIPRAWREVTFGIGLNQLSDYCEERIPIQNAFLKNAAGSMLAGVICGYLSHVPHNLSTMKIMDPSKTYVEHFRKFSTYWVEMMPTSVPNSSRQIVGGVMAVAFPRGLMIRTTQIVGSFIILNGAINIVKTCF